MDARCRIWEEIKQAKANIICIQKYVDRKRKQNRRFSCAIAILASIGAIGNPLWDKIPLIASILIAFLSISKSIKSNLMQPDADLMPLDSLHVFYLKYINSLEKIWYNFDKRHKNEEETMTEFFVLKTTECDKEAILNKGVRNISKKMQKEIDEEVTEYINRIYLKESDNEQRS